MNWRVLFFFFLFIPGSVLAFLSLFFVEPLWADMIFSGFNFTLALFSTIGIFLLNQKKKWEPYFGLFLFLTQVISLFVRERTFDAFLIYPFFLPIFFVFLDVSARVDEMFKRKDALEETQRREREAHLALLQEAIHPHFLFNALTIVNSIYQKDKEKGKEAMESLRKLFSMILSEDSETISFEKEKKVIEEYFRFCSFYVGGNVKLEMIGDSNMVFPRNIIETLIENSVIHGKLFQREDGYIRIEVLDEGDRFLYRVSDNGIGVEKSKKERPSYGLENIKTRISLLGGTYCANGKAGQGYETEITLPKNSLMLNS